MLCFEESYFEGEERSGFFVESKMKRAWAAQLKVLKTVEEICRRHNLRYFAHCGTLIGAVRHQGFIPWDDDIDIAFLRDDYEKFLVAAKEELPEGYMLYCLYTDEGYAQNFARVTNGDGSRLMYEQEHLEQWYGCPYIIGVDIYPWDYLSRDEDEEALRQELLKMVILARFMLHEYTDKAEEHLRVVEQYCQVKFDWNKPMDHQLLVLMDRLSQMFSSNEADEVARIYTYVTEKTARCRKSCFERQEWMPFETTEIAVPVNFDECLKAIYGEDYMTPIISHPHEYPFYDKQEREYQEYLQRVQAKQTGIDPGRQ